MARYTVSSSKGDRIYLADANDAAEALAHLDMIEVSGLPEGVVIECCTAHLMQRWQLVELAEAEERSEPTSS